MTTDQDRIRRARRVVMPDDLERMGKIIDRFEEACPGIYPRHAVAERLLMVHRLVPLRLKDMATWPYVHDITHDISGMMERWDNEKMEFRDCFHPRFAMEQ